MEVKMIDPETIEDFDQCDGEDANVYGYDPETDSCDWGWVPIRVIEEAGRTDVLEWIHGHRLDDMDDAA